MNAETFAEELTTRLGPQYGLRRSIVRPDRWCIEQKVSRAYDYPGTDDKAYRLAHGLHLVLETPISGHLPCPNCHTLLALPVFERAEIECETCRQRGVRSRVMDGYFPLVDRTLTYLERSSPRRGLAYAQEIEEENRQWERSQHRTAANVAEDIGLDRYRELVGIPYVGYTGKDTPHLYGR